MSVNGSLAVKVDIESLRMYWKLVFAIALSMTLQAQDQKTARGGSKTPSKRMADGKVWMTSNLSIIAGSSHCYDDKDVNCRRYGRMYTWEAARRVCPLLGVGWRLPTDDEWRNLAQRYGGLGNDSEAGGKAAFRALMSGGRSGFNAVLGGNRSDGKYERAEAHGFYWTASEAGSNSAPFYNFGKNSGSLYRQPQGEKQRAISVRCIRD